MTLALIATALLQGYGRRTPAAGFAGTGTRRRPTSSVTAPAVPRAYHAQLFIAPSGEPFRGAAKGEPYPVETWFARADADHDGQAHAGRIPARFHDLLRNSSTSTSDGIVDSKEIARYEEEVVPEVPRRLRQRALNSGCWRPGQGQARRSGGGSDGGEPSAMDRISGARMRGRRRCRAAAAATR